MPQGGLKIVPISQRGGHCTALMGKITAGYPKKKKKKFVAGWSEKLTPDTPYYLFKWDSAND